jgi:hypothetical protein
VVEEEIEDESKLSTSLINYRLGLALVQGRQRILPSPSRPSIQTEGIVLDVKTSKTQGALEYSFSDEKPRMDIFVLLAREEGVCRTFLVVLFRYS